MFIIIGLVLLGFAVVLFLGARSAQARLKLVRDTETSRISALKPGLREVKGRLEGKGLVSPLAKKECLLFDLHVEEYRKSGKSGHWRTVIRDLKCDELWLDDGTGKLRLEPAGAELLLEVDQRQKSGTFNDATPEVEAMLREYGKSSTGFVFNKSMRYAETVLEHGDAVYALGPVFKSGDTCVMRKDGKEVFLVSDWPEEKVEKHFKSTSIGQLVFCAILGIGGLVACVAGALQLTRM